MESQYFKTKFLQFLIT